MKKIICIFLFALMALSGNTAFGAELILNDSATKEMVLDIVNSDIAAVSFTIVGLPIVDVVATDPSKTVAFNPVTGDVIVYGLNDSLIASGLIITVQTPHPYGSYVVSIINAVGASGEALNADIQYGGDGVLSITFSEAQVVATANHVVGLGVSGLDLNEDGIITVHDVQLIVNNLE